MTALYDVRKASRFFTKGPTIVRAVSDGGSRSPCCLRLGARRASGYAAHENGDEWPFLPSFSNSSPNALIRDRVARATVRVVVTG